MCPYRINRTLPLFFKPKVLSLGHPFPVLTDQSNKPRDHRTNRLYKIILYMELGKNIMFKKPLKIWVFGKEWKAPGSFYMVLKLKSKGMQIEHN